MKQVFRRVERLCMVVKDAEAAAKEYADIYGVGPWFLRTEKEIVLDGAACRVKSALCCAFVYEVELIEPLEEEGAFADHLKKNGNGLMYLCLETMEEPEEAVKIFTDTNHGTKLLKDGVDGREYVLADYRKELGCYLAVHGKEEALNKSVPEGTVITIPASEEAEIRITAFGQLGFVVEDFYGTMDLLYHSFGLGPFRCTRFDSSNLSDVKYEGQPIEYGLDVSHAMMDQVEFELLAPLDDRSTFGRYLKSHGNGLHHVNLRFDNEYDEVFDCFMRHGTGAVQTAIVANFEFCSFCDHTRSIGLYLEMGKVIADPEGPPPEMPLYPPEAE